MLRNILSKNGFRSGKAQTLLPWEKKSETGREKTPVESLQGMLEHMQGYLKRPVAFARPLVYKKNHG